MPSDAQNLPARLTAPEVGAYLRISLSTVHHLTRLGKLKAEKQGKRWTYLRADVDRYVDEGLSEWIPEGGKADKDRRAYVRRICSLEGAMKIENEGDYSANWARGRVLNVSDQGMLFELLGEAQTLPPELDHLPVSARFSVSAHGGEHAPYVFQGTLLRREGRRLGVLLETPIGHLLESETLAPN